MMSCMPPIPSVNIVWTDAYSGTGAVAAAAIVFSDRRQAGTTLGALAAVLMAPANSQGIVLALCIGARSVAVADAERSTSTTSKIRSAIVRTALVGIEKVAC